MVLAYGGLSSSGWNGRERKSRRYVVIELKNVQAGRNTIGQIMEYLGDVTKLYHHAREPLGPVIARGFDNGFLSGAAAREDVVRYLTLEQVGLT